MKTFCALLMIGIIAYVESNPDACDKYAANTMDKPSSEHDHKDQTLRLKALLERPKTRNFITATTKSQLGEANQWCSGVTHGNTCQAVGHFREITGRPEGDDPDKGADKLVLKTVYVAETGNGYAIKYEFNVNGVNADDYIFESDFGSLKATRVDKNKKETIVTDDIPAVIRAIFTEKFALFYAGTDWALYMTCNAEVMWVTYDSSKATNEQYRIDTKEALDEQIKILKAKVTADKKTPPTLANIEVKMTDVFDRLIPAAA